MAAAEDKTVVADEAAVEVEATPEVVEAEVEADEAEAEVAVEAAVTDRAAAVEWSDEGWTAQHDLLRTGGAE